MIELVEYDNSNEKKLKGYMYDSLVYRYIRAREHMAELEFLIGKGNPNKAHNKDYYTHLAQRDIVRFCQILDEAIGEHD